MVQQRDANSSDLSRRWPTGIILAGVAPLVVLIALFAADVPIGQPHLIYRYSPLWVLRLGAAAVALIIGAPAAVALYYGLRCEGSKRRMLIGTAIVGYAALVAWTLFAPPHYVSQHVFNLESPSHDGAFVLEGRKVSSICEYVSRSFHGRLELEPEDMRGRRVLSNPPGMTILAIITRRAVAASPGLEERLIRCFGLNESQDAKKSGDFAVSMLLAIMFTAFWGCAIVFSYKLCRIWMAPAAATAVAFACVFNPSAVDFTPGKDPAQLVTVMALLWAWMIAYQKKCRWAAAGAGAIVAVSTMIGLIHVWIMAIAASATLWHAATSEGSGVRSWLSRGVLPAIGGYMLVASFAYLALNWNIALTGLRVGLRYGQIQENVITDPLYWMLLGLPMFLLFVGPMVWVQATVMRRDVCDPPARLGRYLLICTLVVMAYSYFAANNSETPRLWMPFIPLLIIGLALRRSPFREDNARSRWICVVLICLQLVVTVAHWSLMDVRESEYRLTTGRMWD